MTSPSELLQWSGIGWAILCLPVMGRHINRRLKSLETTHSLLRMNDETIMREVNHHDVLLDACMRVDDKLAARIETLEKEAIRDAT